MEERLRFLFKRYLDNNCTQSELEEFFTYVQKAENDNALRELIRQVYEGLKEQYLDTTYVDENGRLVLTDPSRDSREKPAISNAAVKNFAPFSMAAILVIAIATIWFIARRNSQQQGQAAELTSLTTKSTNRSESKLIVLDDSTQVWLNAASSLEFPDKFDHKKREVYLTGEAYFDVRHAEKKPFVIHTGRVSTTVLGTAFNIKAYPGERLITVSVSRGSVKVTRGDGREVVLNKGQQLKLDEDAQETIERNIGTETVAGWQRGTISYDDEQFEDIVADLERVYNVSIRVTKKSLSGLRVSTSFKRDIGVGQALQVLCRLTDSQLAVEDGQYIIQ